MNTVKAAPIRRARNRATERRIFEHVKATMRPENSPDLDWSRPPQDDPVELVEELLLVPEKRDRVMVNCPICSPNSPQFYHGWVSFFPVEGVYRFIGYECASKYFGRDKIDAAKHESTAAKHHDTAIEFVFDHLGLVPAMIAAFDDVIPAAEHAEYLWHGIGSAHNVRPLLRKVIKEHGNRLVLTRTWTVEIPHETIPDKFIMERKSEPVNFGTLQGALILRTYVTILSGIREHRERLKRIERGGNDAAGVWVLSNIEDRPQVADARNTIDAAERAYKEVRETITDFAKFFDPQNLKALRTWGLSDLNAERLSVIYDDDTVRLKLSHSAGAKIKVDRKLMANLPDWPSKG